MDPNRFNQACQHLQHEQMVKIKLITGQTLTGFFLRYIKANNSEGSLELQTKRGISQILSSSIENIDLANDQLA